MDEGIQVQGEEVMAKIPDIEVGVKWMAAILRPGDTLVVAVDSDRPLSFDEVEDYRRHLEALLPGTRAVIIPAAALAIYRPGDEKD
jgi:hypothetical protein